jgi:hypothetical protein
VVVLTKREDVFGIIVYCSRSRVPLVEGAYAVYLGDLSSDDFKVVLVASLLNPLVHLLGILSLLSNCYLITLIHEFLNVLFQVALMKPNHPLHLPRWNAKIKDLARDHGILKVKDKPFTPAIEDYLIEVLALDFPVALHAWCHFFIVLLRDLQGSWIVVGVVRASAFCVSYVFRLSEPGAIFHLIH